MLDLCTCWLGGPKPTLTFLARRSLVLQDDNLKNAAVAGSCSEGHLNWTIGLPLAACDRESG